MHENGRAYAMELPPDLHVGVGESVPTLAHIHIIIMFYYLLLYNHYHNYYVSYYNNSFNNYYYKLKIKKL